MGLILKTKITEQQAQDAAISADTAAKFSDVLEKIQTEKADRELADVQLQNAIATEKNLREAADELLQNNLDNEVQSRISADSRLQQNINSEATARQTADTTLQNSLDTERNSRITATNALDTKIDAEISNRQNANTNLENALTGEATTREAADEILDAKIETEISNRTAAGVSFENRLNAETASRTAADTILQNNLDAEVQNRQTALTDMQAAIMVSLGDSQALQNIENENLKNQIQEQAESQSANVFNLQNNLNTEILNRQNADTAIRADLNSNVANLRNDLNSEIQNRKNADNSINSNIQTLDEKIDTETTNRTQALNDMQAAIMVSLGDSQALQNIENENLKNQISSQTAIQSASISTLRDDLNSEIQNRTSGDNSLNTRLNTLSNSLNSEIQNRQTAIQDMQAAILASLGDSQALQNIENENLKNQIESQTALQAASISTLRNDLNSEIQNRTAADTSLANSIQNEVTARTNAISNLQSTLTTTINSKATSTLSDAKTYADEKFSGVASSLNDFTAPTATANGIHGLVPAPPKGTGLLVLTTQGWMALTDTNVQIANTPNQSGTLTYNRGSQSPTWANFDSNKLTIGGTTSATTAGSYTATFTPSGLYVWADTKDQSAKSVTWTIQPLKLAKPTAASTTFTYDGNNKSLTISNYNSTYMTESGTKSASAVGSYSVKYTLKNTTNTKWADNSTSAVTISWTIGESKLTAAQSSGFAQVGSLTYNGSSQSPTIQNYDSTVHVLSGTTSSVNAGTFTAKISPKSGMTWYDGSNSAKDVTWTIGAMKLAKPTASTTFFGVDGSEHSLTISNYNSTYMTESGTKKATAMGNYSVSYTLKNTTNTKWIDSTTAAVVINWTIGETKLSAAQSSGFEQVGTLTFNAQMQSPTIQNYDSAVHVLGGTTSASDVGTLYGITITPKSGYTWNDGTKTAKNVTWSIATLKVPKPTLAGDTYFTYDGQVKTLLVNYDPDFVVPIGTTSTSVSGTYTVEYRLKYHTYDNSTWEDGTIRSPTFIWQITSNTVGAPQMKYYISYTGQPITPISSYAEDLITLSGTTSAVDVGTYTFTTSLKRPDLYTWVDGSVADKTYTWTILKRTVTAPTLSTTSYEYTGSNITPTFSDLDTASDYYTVTGTQTAKNAGSYSVTASLKDKTNCIWKSGSTDDIVLTWTINKKSLTKPTLSNASLTYNGSAQSPTINNFDSTYESQTGTASATNAGNYTLTVKLRNTTNYCWADSTTANVSLSWSIAKLQVVEPTLATSSYEYTGGTIEAAFNNLDLNSSYYTVSGDLSAKNVGSYTITFRLMGSSGTGTHNVIWKNAQNYQDVSLTWAITAKKLTAAQSTFTFTGDLTFAFNSHTSSTSYNAKSYALKDYLSGYDSNYHTLGGTISSNKAGTFTATITPKDGYAFSDGSTAAKEITWTVKPMVVDKPSFPTTFTYTGSYIDITRTVQFEYGGNWRGASPYVIGAKDVGTYQTAMMLRYNGNLVWSDTLDDSDYVFTWQIVQAELQPPTLTQSVFEYDGTAKTVSLANDNLYVVVSDSSVLSATEVGTYSVIVKLYDKNSSHWSDGTTENKTLTWKITKILLERPSLDPGYFVYDGTEKTPTIEGYDSATMYIASGNTSATEIGEYSIVIKPKANYTFGSATFDQTTLTWTIGTAALPVPSVESLNVGLGTYTSGAQYDDSYVIGGRVACSFTLNNFNVDLMTGRVVPPGAYPVEYVDSGQLNIRRNGSNYYFYMGSEKVRSNSPLEIRFNLKDTEHYTWSNGTVTQKEITRSAPSFVIPEQLSYAQMAATLRDLSYDGNKKNWLAFFGAFDGPKLPSTACCFNETHMDNSQRIEKIGPERGEYTLTLTPIPNVTWHDGSTESKTFTLRIV